MIIINILNISSLSITTNHKVSKKIKFYTFIKNSVEVGIL
jgi:hypothetical protein